MDNKPAAVALAAFFGYCTIGAAAAALATAAGHTWAIFAWAAPILIGVTALMCCIVITLWRGDL